MLVLRLEKPRYLDYLGKSRYATLDSQCSANDRKKFAEAPLLVLAQNGALSEVLVKVQLTTHPPLQPHSMHFKFAVVAR